MDSLNHQTIYQAKVIQKKISNKKFASPNRSFSLNVQTSPNVSLTDSLDGKDLTPSRKNYKEVNLQLSPGNLIPTGDPLKELGYSSPDDELQFTIKVRNV